MKLKRHNWLKLRDNRKLIEITIRGDTNEKLDFFRVDNNNDYNKVIAILKNKYGFNPDIKKEEEKNFNEEIKSLMEFRKENGY
ncbi:MAG: hypothetical protein ACOC3V_01360 [bacterium]